MITDRTVTEQVRERLQAPADRSLARRAATRAARSRRRQWLGGAGAAVVVLVVCAVSVVAPGWSPAAPSAATPAPAPAWRATDEPGASGAQALRRAAAAGLDPDAMLDAGDLAAVMPSAGLVRAGVVRADDANDAGGSGGLPSSTAVRGGWCGDSALPGAAHPLTWWVARWVSSERAVLGALTPALTQQVLRFDATEAAQAFLAASGASPTRCFSSADPSSPGRDYALQAVRTPDGSTVLLAVAPLANTEDSWSVRAMGGRGADVVDLTLTATAPTAERAGLDTLALMEAAVARAAVAVGEDASPSGQPRFDELP